MSTTRRAKVSGKRACAPRPNTVRASVRDQAPAPPPDEMLDAANRLHSAALHLLRRLRRVDHASGLTAARLSALSVVVFGGPCSLGDLARAEQVRPPTMTRIIAELEVEGLVQRRGDPNDRRVSRIHATPAGVRLLEAGRSRRVALLVEWLGALNAVDRRRLDDALPVMERLGA